MKYLIAFAIGTISAGYLLAQGVVGGGTHRYSKYPSYSPNTPPPVTLPEAYALAQSQIHNSTNGFYCIAASCIEMTNAGFTGWALFYANTNGQRGRVNVYFDGEVSVVAGRGEVLIK